MFFVCLFFHQKTISATFIFALLLLLLLLSGQFSDSFTDVIRKYLPSTVDISTFTRLINKSLRKTCISKDFCKSPHCFFYTKAHAKNVSLLCFCTIVHKTLIHNITPYCWIDILQLGPGDSRGNLTFDLQKIKGKDQSQSGFGDIVTYCYVILYYYCTLQVLF